MGGWTVGKGDNKANSVQLLLQLPTGTELGNMLEVNNPSTFVTIAMWQTFISAIYLCVMD